MSKSIGIAALTAALALASVSFAQAPAGAPAGTTGLCKDGSYYSGATKKGACRGHQGVKEWYGTSSAASSGTSSPAAPAAAAASKAAPAAAATAAKTKAETAPAATAAPGGGPGMVWVNKSSKAYHCSTDKWYGKTKNGEYLSEADAKAQGFHAAHGKACQ
jgi:hypothetical protein